MTSLDGAPSTAFDTFCLEMTQALDPAPYFGDGIYTVASITPAADNGIPVADETKFLFGSYISGTLSAALSGLFTYDNASASNNLQQAIWFFEGNGLSKDDLDQGAKDIVDAVNALKAADPDSFGTSSINALNLYSVTSPVDQTQALIIMAPANAAPPPPSVPEPTTLSIWGGLCIAGLVVAGRRRRIS